MSAARKALRAQAAMALQAILPGTPLAGARVLSAWRQDLDSQSLPALGFATPSTRFEPASEDTTQSSTTLVLVVKRAGGDDLEDLLDDDAEAIGMPLVEALMQVDRGVELTSSAIDISGAGSPRIGTLTLTFDIIDWRDRAQLTGA